MWRPKSSEEVDRTSLEAPLAIAFAKYVEETCADFAQLRECRRYAKSGREIVSLDLKIGVPQRPIYPILPTEAISVAFFPDNEGAPWVFVAREDFPDTPHQNLMPEGQPSALCIDDRPWQDARANYTPSELMGRIVMWFDKACQGELHGTDQPYDPVFLYDSAHEVIVTSQAEQTMADGERLDIWTTDDSRKYLIVVPFDRERAASVSTAGLQVVYAEVRPDKMSRIRRAPQNLRRLVEMLKERDLDLLPALQSAVEDWLALAREDRDKAWSFCILLHMPQIHPRTGEIGSTNLSAFMCSSSGGEIGQALGILDANDSDQAGEVKYVRLFAAKPQAEGLDTIGVSVAPVHLQLNAARAKLMSGREETAIRRVAMIGAGSLGSSLAEMLVREGQFQWTIIDDDFFLPHNVSRHTLLANDLGRSKVNRLASRLHSIRGDADLIPIHENVLRGGPDGKAAGALDSADLIVDASASVTVSRWLADRPSTPRVLSTFFTPAGRSAVLMCESAERKVTLRDVEAVYLREVLTNPLLHDHHQSGQQMRFTGACRALTNRIPTSSVAVLSGLIAGSVPDASSAEDPVLKIWTMRDNGAIDCLPVPVATIRAEAADWTVLFVHSLLDELVEKRKIALPNETGGSLMGMIDYEARIISVVHALPAPKDSVGTPTSFERGKRNLRRRIDDAQTRSGGQVRYVGEWHSHPAGHSAAPSSVDMKQIEDLSVALEIDGLPAVSLIIGETDIGFLIREAHHG